MSMASLQHRTLTREQIVRLTERVEGAQKRAYAIPKLTDEYPGMTMGDGYAVQLELRRRFARWAGKPASPPGPRCCRWG
jgi:2-keto-4-pentenoate hydratase